MEQKLYLECYAGISGDMMVAALLDLGADESVLRKALESLPVDGFDIRISRVKKSGIDACDFAVVLDEAHENHDHDMEYLYGHSYEHGEGHDYSHTHSHEEEDHHEHGHGHHHDAAHAHHEHEGHEGHGGHSHVHPHTHRRLQDVLYILEQAKLTEGARRYAKRIFEILAEAEAKAHGTDKEQVHFHEVGAVDSIVDITAVAVCMDNLGITETIIPVLYEGTGFVRCQHGMMTIPVPAVAATAEAHHLPLHITERKGELVTPTGAAIAAAFRTSGSLPQRFSIKKTGIGAGKRSYEYPSLLRAMLIEELETTKEDVVYKLESNIDDCTGEALGYVMERLFEAGARDVHYIPVYMKKNRPAYELCVICMEEDIPRLEEIIFAETTTIGIRRQKMERTVLKREKKEIETPLGKANIKLCKVETDGGGFYRAYPEYESVAALCREHGKSYQEVYQMIVRAYHENQ